MPKSIYVYIKYKNNPLLHSKGLQTNTHYEQGFVFICTLHPYHTSELRYGFEKNNTPKNPIKWRYITESEKQIPSIKDVLLPRAV